MQIISKDNFVQRFIYETMLKNIISEITADKKARNVEPTHAMFKEVYSIAISKGLSLVDVRNGLNELYLAGEIEVGRTINDKYIRVL